VFFWEIKTNSEQSAENVYASQHKTLTHTYIQKYIKNVKEKKKRKTCLTKKKLTFSSRYFTAPLATKTPLHFFNDSASSSPSLLAAVFFVPEAELELGLKMNLTKQEAHRGNFTIISLELASIDLKYAYTYVYVYYEDVSECTRDEQDDKKCIENI
jgi:hypothetical protein